MLLRFQKGSEELRVKTSNKTHEKYLWKRQPRERLGFSLVWFRLLDGSQLVVRLAVEQLGTIGKSPGLGWFHPSIHIKKVQIWSVLHHLWFVKIFKFSKTFENLETINQACKTQLYVENKGFSHIKQKFKTRKSKPFTSFKYPQLILIAPIKPAQHINVNMYYLEGKPAKRKINRWEELKGLFVHDAI